MMTEDEMTELPGCPFCGSHALENLDAALYGGPVMCIDCGARGPVRFSQQALRMPGVKDGISDGISDGIEAWRVRASFVALCLLLTACGRPLTPADCSHLEPNSNAFDRCEMARPATTYPVWSIR